MNDFSFMKKMSEEDAYLFKRCIRKMLDTTFILADQDEKLYDYISSESNQYDVNTYLAAIGSNVVVEERMKVSSIVDFVCGMYWICRSCTCNGGRYHR